MDDNKSNLAQSLLDAFGKFKRLHGKGNSIEGLRHSEIAFLFCIKREAPLDSSGLKVSEISNILSVTAPTVTQMVKSLEGNGFVERSADPSDRRAVRIKLTDKGERTLKKAMDDLYASFEGLVDYLGEEKTNEFIDLLHKVSNYFNERKG